MSSKNVAAGGEHGNRLFTLSASREPRASDTGTHGVYLYVCYYYYYNANAAGYGGRGKMCKTNLVYRHFIYCLRVPPEEMVGGGPVSDDRRGSPCACVSRRCGDVRDGQVKIRQIKRTIKTKGKSETKRKKRKGNERRIGWRDRNSSVLGVWNVFVWLLLTNTPGCPSCSHSRSHLL